MVCRLNDILILKIRLRKATTKVTSFRFLVASEKNNGTTITSYTQTRNALWLKVAKAGRVYAKQKHPETGRAERVEEKRERAECSLLQTAITFIQAAIMDFHSRDSALPENSARGETGP